MLDAIHHLQSTVQEWISAGAIQELSWGRMLQLESQEALRERDKVFRTIENSTCTRCDYFDDDVRHFISFCKFCGLSAIVCRFPRGKILAREHRRFERGDLRTEFRTHPRVRTGDKILCNNDTRFQINSVNELALTELILENTLANYEPEEVVALLSGFVFQEKADAELVIPPKLLED